MTDEQRELISKAGEAVRPLSLLAHSSKVAVMLATDQAKKSARYLDDSIEREIETPEELEQWEADMAEWASDLEAAARGIRQFTVLQATKLRCWGVVASTT